MAGRQSAYTGWLQTTANIAPIGGKTGHTRSTQVEDGGNRQLPAPSPIPPLGPSGLGVAVVCLSQGPLLDHGRTGLESCALRWPAPSVSPSGLRETGAAELCGSSKKSADQFRQAALQAELGASRTGGGAGGRRQKLSGRGTSAGPRPCGPAAMNR